MNSHLLCCSLTGRGQIHLNETLTGSSSAWNLVLKKRHLLVLKPPMTLVQILGSTKLLQPSLPKVRGALWSHPVPTLRISVLACNTPRLPTFYLTIHLHLGLRWKEQSPDHHTTICFLCLGALCFQGLLLRAF